jgi:transcription antitermination factor NusB
MNRHESREAVFCLLFEWEYHPDSHYLDVYNLARLSREIEENEYIKFTFKEICEKVEEIDKIINAAAVGWRSDRMSKVSRAILRLGVFELNFGGFDRVPEKVAINEAIDIAKEYDDENAPAFINGILNKIMKNPDIANEIDASVSEITAVETSADAEPVEEVEETEATE